jgi:deoxyribonuclease IV
MRFGVHVGIGKGFGRTVEEALAAGCECVQIFAGNPRAFRLSAYDAKAWDEFYRLRKQHGIQPVVIHTSYLINLATNDKGLHAKSVALVENDLKTAAKAKIEYVNTHLGSYGSQDRKTGFTRICATIRRMVKAAPAGPMLLLENSAGAGNNAGGTMEELGAILREVGSKRVGVCLDTAHAWASGYDISTAAGVKAFLAEIKKHIGFRNVRALHLNDTQVALGARRDLHWHVARGNIGETGFQNLLRAKELAHVAVICETPKTLEEDRANVQAARRLAGVRTAGRSTGRGKSGAKTKPARNIRTAPAVDIKVSAKAKTRG